MTHTKSKPSTLLSTIARLGVLLIVIACVVGQVHAGDDGGYALDFDGSDDWVDATNNGGAKDSAANLGLPTGDITLEVWAKPTSYGTWRSMVSFFQDNGSFERGWDLETRGGNRFAFALAATSGGSLTYMETTNTFQPNTWYHVTGTYDGTTMRVYVNGVLENTSTSESGDILYDDSWLAIGMYKDDNEAFSFPGQIDEVRIWNVVRTQEQIQADMFKELTGSEANLVGYWKFTNGPGSGTVTDNSGNGHTGTLNAMDPSTDWVDSTAPIGNATAAGRTEVAGMWAADTSADSNVLTIANNTFLQDVGDDIIFGHDGSDATPNGTTTADLGSSAAVQRWTWTWYLDKTDLGTTGGTVDFTFDEGGSPTAAGNYRLLYRSGASGSFADVATATGIGPVIFSGVDVDDIDNGYYTLGTVDTSEDPLLIDLASFSATANEDGVLVAWETASEIDNAGFNVYRQAAEGEWLRLNAALIPAQGGPTQGAAYSFLDAATSGGYYKLEDVDTSGVSTFHGPVSAEGGDPTSVGLVSLAASALKVNAPVALLVIPLLALGGGGLLAVWRRKRR